MDIEAIVNRAYTSWVYGKGTAWTDHMRAALTELAAGYEQKLALMARAVDTDYEQLYREAGERILQLEDVLRSLACSLSAGGYNADTVDLTVFEKKIRDGIDMLVAPLQDRISQLEAELERLRKDAESYRRLVESAKAEAGTHCTYPDCICPDGVSMGSCNLGLPDAAIAAGGEKK